MSSSTYVVGVRIDGNAASYLRATQQAQNATKSFGRATRAEYEKLKSFMQSTQGQLAGLGLGVGIVQIQKNAARLERTLTQVALTAGMSVAEQKDAYQQMFEMVKRNGGAVEDTVGSFNSLIQAGLKYKEAMNATGAINVAQAVTGANANVLANALTVGAGNFNFDLSKAGVAMTMLDKMTVSGRLGNAELENLSSILPRVASGAQRAGMDFDKTLAFVQALSMTEKQPERLATLAESTTRLFTNMNYSKDAEKALGIQMFDKTGGRRDPVGVLEDMRKRYQSLTTDAQRFNFMGKAFGKTDLDTQRGLSSLMTGEILIKMREFDALSRKAGGALNNDLHRATDNAVSQAERLGATLREAAEGFARPINDAFANGVRYMLDSKAQGGMGLGGGAIAGGAAAGALGVYALSRVLPGVIGKLVGRTGGLAAGVAEGKALQAAAGVTPVYVTNWAEMNGGGSGGGLLGLGGAAAGGAAGAGALAKLRTMLALAPLAGKSSLAVAGLGYTAAGVGLAGAAGYGVGTGIYKYGLEGNRGGDFIGESIARVLATFGNEEAQRSLAMTDALKNAKVGGEVTVRVVGAPGMNVQTETKPFNGTRMNTNLGQTNQGAGW